MKVAGAAVSARLRENVSVLGGGLQHWISDHVGSVAQHGLRDDGISCSYPPKCVFRQVSENKAWEELQFSTGLHPPVQGFKEIRRG